MKIIVIIIDQGPFAEPNDAITGAYWLQLQLSDILDLNPQHRP